MTIDAGGITLNGPMVSSIFGGQVTSTAPFLTFYFKGNPFVAGGYLNIEDAITDSSQKVGIRIASGGNGAIFLSGSRSNTFTGNVEISGTYNGLVLNKSGGAIAVLKDIFVRDGGMLRFADNQQVSRTSSVKLETSGWVQLLSISGRDIKTTFKNLTIEDRGALAFNHEEGESIKSKYYIFLDDLIINRDGHLQVHGWESGRDFLLVKKTSAHLADALTKMTFEGYDRNNIHLEDFNDEYWSISATPESATYGALSAAAALGLWAWRKREKRLSNNLAAK